MAKANVAPITLPSYQQERIGSQIAETEKIVAARPRVLTDVVTNYCPGCTHGIVNRLVAECINELGIEGKTVGIAPVGCSVMMYDFRAGHRGQDRGHRARGLLRYDVRLL